MDLTHFVNLTKKVSDDVTLEAPGNNFLRLLLVTSLFLRYVSSYIEIHYPHQLHLIVFVNLTKKLLFINLTLT